MQSLRLLLVVNVEVFVNEDQERKEGVGVGVEVGASSLLEIKSHLKESCSRNIWIGIGNRIRHIDRNRDTDMSVAVGLEFEGLKENFD